MARQVDAGTDRNSHRKPLVSPPAGVSSLPILVELGEQDLCGNAAFPVMGVVGFS